MSDNPKNKPFQNLEEFLYFKRNALWGNWYYKLIKEEGQSITVCYTLNGSKSEISKKLYFISKFKDLIKDQQLYTLNINVIRR